SDRATGLRGKALTASSASTSNRRTASLSMTCRCSDPLTGGCSCTRPCERDRRLRTSRLPCEPRSLPELWMPMRMLSVTTAQPDSDTRRDQPKVATDPRRAAWRPFRDMCNRLAGDSVLVPPLMRRDRLTRHDLTPIALWSDMTEDDIPRLAILTDSFARFIGHGDDASVLTLWREGTPAVVQIDGEPNEEAVDLVTDVINGNIARIDNVRAAEPEAANDNRPWDARLREAFEGGTIRFDAATSTHILADCWHEGKLGTAIIAEDGEPYF